MAGPGWIMYGPSSNGVRLTDDVADQAITLLRTTAKVYLRDFPTAQHSDWVAALVRKTNEPFPPPPLPVSPPPFMKVACRYRDTDDVKTMDIVVLFQKMKRQGDIWVFSLGFDNSLNCPLHDFEPEDLSPVLNEYLDFVGRQGAAGALDPAFNWHWSDRHLPAGEINVLHTVADLQTVVGLPRIKSKIQLIDAVAGDPRSKWLLSGSKPIKGYGDPGPSEDHFWGGSSSQNLLIHTITLKP